MGGKTGLRERGGLPMGEERDQNILTLSLQSGDKKKIAYPQWVLTVLSRPSVTEGAMDILKGREREPN